MPAEVKTLNPKPNLKKLEERLYVGMDVGGTKIRTSLVSEGGMIFAHLKAQTPRDCEPEATIEAIKSSIRELLDSQQLPISRITAIGIAIPGVVEPETGNVVVTPNMNLTGIPLGSILTEEFGVPVFLSNDGNLGTLGETWLGAARNARSAVGIFVGTGVGSGIVVNERLWTGAGHAAGEIGHMVVSTPARGWKERLEAILPPGVESEKTKSLPVCGCGNIGCLETFASRTAIEHAIQEALALGIPSKITELAGGDVSIIKAGLLAKALKAQDPLVTAVVQYTAEVLAYACLTVRHLIDPEVIIFGGGVMEACHRFILPVIEQIIATDKLPAAPSRRRIVLSQLGDDAVVLGAVALARARTDHIENPIEAIHEESEVLRLKWDEETESVKVGDRAVDSDFYATLQGAVVERRESGSKIHRSELKAIFSGMPVNETEREESSEIPPIDPALEQLAKEGTLLIIGARDVKNVRITQKALDFLTVHGIYARVCTLSEGVEVLNHANQPTAAIFLLDD